MKLLISALVLLFLTAFVAAQQANYTKTQVYGQGLVNATAGIPAQFYLQLRDNNNNNVNVCPGGASPFTIRLTGPSTNNTLASSCASGRYSTTYNSKYAGKYVVTVSVAGQVIPNGTFSPTMNSGAINPQNCIISGVPANFQGIVGQSYSFQLSPFDQYNNPVTSCPVAPSTWVVTLTGATPGTGSINTCNSTTGIYTGTFTARQSGRYDMAVNLNNVPVGSKPTSVNFNPGPVYPPNSVFSGATTVYAGDKNTVQVIPYDKYNNAITKCYNTSVLNWNATIQLGGVSYPVNYVSCNNASSTSPGVYNLEYNVTKASTAYQLVIQINGQAIQRPSVAVTVTAARAISASETTAQGDGLTSGTSGVANLITILPSDAYGNPNTRCDVDDPSDFELTLTAVDNSSITCGGEISSCDSTTGYYTATWSCPVATNYSLEIEYLDLPISGSPFYPYNYPGYLVGPNTHASGSGISVAYAGVRAYVYLDPHDRNDNQITTCAAPTFDPTLLSITVTTNNNDGQVQGRFESCDNSTGIANITVSYAITSIDLTVLSITYQGLPVIASPFPLTTYPGPPAAGFCNATGPGLVSTTAGDYGLFNVTCTDQYRNPIYNCLDLSLWYVNVTSANSFLAGEAYYCANSSDTTVPAVTSLRYNETVSGQYTLTFGYDNVPLNPYQITVFAGALDPANTVAEGDGVSSQTIPAGNRTQFVLLARDRFNNTITQCLPASSFQITSYPTLQNLGGSGPSLFKFVPCSQTDNITQVQYFSTFASTYNITILFNGKSIYKSPYRPTIIAGPIDGSTIIAEGPGLYSAAAGVSANFTLKAEDKYSNPVNTCAGPSIYPAFGLALVKSDNSSLVLQGHVFNCTQGIYLAHYTAFVSGVYNLSIYYDATPIKNNSFFPVVDPGPNNDSMAYVVVVDKQTVAGEAGELIVVPRDSYGNNVSSCSPKLIYTSIFTGIRAGKQNQTVSSSVSCNADGTYTIPYTLYWAVSWSARVFGGSANNVSNSPVAVSVIPADIYQENSYLVNPPVNQNLVIGQTVQYTLVVADEYFNNITTCPEANVTQANWQVYTRNTATKKQYNGTISCNGGEYSGTFTALQVGKYHLSVVYEDEDIEGSPYYPLNFIYGYPSSLSYAVGPGVDSQSLIAGQTTVFTITTYNQYNISIQSCPPAPFSGSNFTVTFDESYDVYHPTYTTVQVSDCDPVTGVFTGTYTPNKARKYTVVIKLDGNDIRLDPYTPTVVPAGIDPYMTIVSGLTNTTSDNGTFQIQPRDRFGNDETSVDKDDFTVVLSPTCVTSNISLTEDDGLITVHYSVSEGGVYCPALLYKVDDVVTNVQLNGTIHAIGGTACSASCNYKGYCFRNVAPSTDTADFSCSCFQGWTGVYCADNMHSKYPLTVGAIVGLVIGLALLMFIIGLIIGWVVFKFLPSRRGGADRETLL